jgi:hypothetical protein
VRVNHRGFYTSVPRQLLIGVNFVHIAADNQTIVLVFYLNGFTKTFIGRASIGMTRSLSFR